MVLPLSIFLCGKLFKNLTVFPPNLYPLPLIPTTAQVLQAKHFLSQKLVLSAPDKSSGISDLYCPSILWKEMQTTTLIFIDNPTYLQNVFCNILNTHLTLKSVVPLALLT